MATTKRRKQQMERQLIVTLTEACETAKAEIPGFSWLTHDNGNQEFPAELRVTWIFDTEANLDRALVNGDDQRMRALTRAAFEETGIDPKLAPSCLQFDSEEACGKAQDGDWIARLAQIRRARH
ncbi:MAG: hypothetical protein HLUCCX14_06025 [Marinobacter excellens HL-55]|uniref:Uncharacterized protein n=1 Tax=Marinobacter excellens HL-55 TaxID=1305731 RepID=A0A0P7ZJ45_9GAMM|nr:MAG: hypothetical protein HLUCCX14_06025 [Marinobacter excellens HL-55]